MEIIRTGGETNTYLITDGECCIVIDPASRIVKLSELIGNRKVEAILLTHGHFDHIRTVDALADIHNGPVYLHEDDEEMVRSGVQLKHYGYNSAAHISHPITYLSEGAMKIGSFMFEVIFTPGHTNGSVCYLFGKDLFCGDTLFKGSIGRTDLPGGNDRLMKDSLRTLKQLDPDIIVHPGHESESIMSYELENNRFLLR